MGAIVTHPAPKRRAAPSRLAVIAAVLVIAGVAGVGVSAYRGLAGINLLAEDPLRGLRWWSDALAWSAVVVFVAIVVSAVAVLRDAGRRVLPLISLGIGLAGGPISVFVGARLGVRVLQDHFATEVLGAAATAAEQVSADQIVAHLEQSGISLGGLEALLRWALSLT